MNRKQAIVVGMAASLFIISGCITSSIKSPHIGEASLAWYAYVSKDNFEDKAVKEAYQKKIGEYLLLHPQTSKEAADKMKNCRVILGMTEEQVLVMVKPSQILKGWKRSKKIFKYSDVGKFGWTRFIGEGIKIRITLTNGIVTDISEIDTILGV